jgi:hypothetical protein
MGGITPNVLLFYIVMLFTIERYSESFLPYQGMTSHSPVRSSARRDGGGNKKARLAAG